MILIPQETMERLESQKTSTTVPTDPAGRLDQEMRSILVQEDKTDREKWKLYRQVLHRYLFFTGESRKPLQFNVRSVANEGALEQTASDSEGPAQPPTEDIVVSVPQKYQKKAELLLKHLLQNSDGKLSWNREGQVFIDGTTIEGANIVDLVNDVVRERKNVVAVGRQPFANFLHKVHTPLEYIGNPAFQKANNTPRFSQPMRPLRPITPAQRLRRERRVAKNAAGIFSTSSSSSSEQMSAGSSGEQWSSASESPLKKPSKQSKKGAQTGGHWWTLKLR